MRILVTGAGGPAGVCTIKALKGKHDVISVDSDRLASGLYLSDKSYLVPLAKDAGFVPRILRICKKEGIRFIIPTVGEELPVFAKNIDLFSKNGITVAVSNLKSIEIANNKLYTYTFFKDEAYCPEIYSVSNVRFPCVVKPVNSRGSRGFHICLNKDELKVALSSNKKKFKESIIMEYLKGEEYSVYGISGLDGRSLLAIPNKRIHTSGESKKAQIVPNERVCKTAKDMAEKLGLIGPWNVQLMDSGRSVKIVEVNPRLAGTTSLVIASGIDFIGLIIKIFSNRKIGKRELRYKQNVIMTRYNEEVFLSPGEVIRDA
jgi:carbamoyl-phosphate synthase large subunit